MKRNESNARPAMVWWACLAVLAGGCLADDDEDETLASSANAPDVIEIEGQMYERLEPVNDGIDVVEDPNAAERDFYSDERDEDDEVVPLEERSREELADALRPVLIRDGHRYVAAEPAWEAADAVLTGDREASLIALGEQRPGREHVERQDDDFVFREIIGDSDERTRVTNTSIAPHNAIVQLMLWSGNSYLGHCTGFYIGPWTLVTSAHCFQLSNGVTVNRVMFTPGRNGLFGTAGPYDCRNDDANGSNDYDPRVPAGYSFGADPALDYAVVDTFPCHSAPTWFPGFMPNAGGANYAMHGYTGGVCPGAPWANDFQCGMSASSSTNDWRMESGVMDSQPGQSGAPWYGWWNAFYPVAIHKGYRTFYDFFACGFDVCKRNYGRRIDNAVTQFIIDNSWDY